MPEELVQWAEDGGRKVRLVVNPDHPGLVVVQILENDFVLAEASLALFRALRIGPFVTALQEELTAELAAKRAQES